MSYEQPRGEAYPDRRDPRPATVGPDDDTRVFDGRAARATATDRDGDGVRDSREDRDGDGVADSREVQETREVRDGGDTTLRQEVLRREEERFGGFKFGAAFFGWLTAMGAALLLTALVAAIGAAIGLTSPGAVQDAAEAAEENLGGATIISAVAIGLVLFLAYFAGGYVAGRMARFSGVKQGIAVWLWAIVIAIIVAIISALAGAEWDILAALDGFPRIPITPETATLTGILTAVGAAIVTLVGAILGGMAGMRYHRRVDRVGLGA
ncbi:MULTISPECIES: hypothetical protein [Microbacterium]|uniref:hypothetical protein n=1 Tax=Microbacterium TaxID=33882 RepID=UPI001CB719B8|nr:MULTISPECIES: hypothetical protein [Microbacterium]